MGKVEARGHTLQGGEKRGQEGTPPAAHSSEAEGCEAWGPLCWLMRSQLHALTGHQLVKKAAGPRSNVVKPEKSGNHTASNGSSLWGGRVRPMNGGDRSQFASGTSTSRGLAGSTAADQFSWQIGTVREVFRSRLGARAQCEKLSVCASHLGRRMNAMQPAPKVHGAFLFATLLHFQLSFPAVHRVHGWAVPVCFLVVVCPRGGVRAQACMWGVYERVRCMHACKGVCVSAV